jgi:Protein of unknown function (DUF1569)
MNEDQVRTFYQRINNLKIDQKAVWGKMNVSQMICHCADGIRMALGTKNPKVYGNISRDEIIELAKAGKTVPTPDGYGQVEGDGTPPIDFESDKQLLKDLIKEFSKPDEAFVFPPHAYFGSMTREQWVSLVIYHLDHHLKQFGV